MKGERCLSPKCAMVKRPYAPGQKAKKVRQIVSAYGKELKEKQKLKNWYNLTEKQFSNYIMDILGKKSRAGDASVMLLIKLESRLDNVVFQMGFASSRVQARQIVSHGFFLVNAKKVNIPSYRVKKGDKISLRPQAGKKAPFQNLTVSLKNHKAPSWIKIDAQKLEAEIINKPALENVVPPAEISSIFEFYSK